MLPRKSISLLVRCGAYNVISKLFSLFYSFLDQNIVYSYIYIFFIIDLTMSEQNKIYNMLNKTDVLYGLFSQPISDNF